MTVSGIGNGGIASASVKAQQSGGTATISLKDLNQSDLTLQGLDGRDSIYFPLPSNMTEATPAQLIIVYQASPLLDPQRASLTIMANNLTLTSLHPEIDGKEHTVQVEIPSTELQDTFIRIQLIGRLDLAGDVECPHINDPGQWLTIKNTSSIQLSPQDNILQPFLDQLPTVLAVINPIGVRPPVIFVVPDNPTANDLSVAARVAARFGHETDGALFPYQVETASSLNSLERTQANLVVVGLPGKQPLITEFAAGLPLPVNGTTFGTAGGAPISGSAAVVQIFNSPTNPARKILLVSGTDDAALELAGEGFADVETYDAFIGKTQYAVFDKLAGTALTTTPGEPWTTDSTSLASLGFGDQTLNGLGIRETTLYIQRPLGWLLEPGTQLTLHIAYSSALTTDSHLTVSVNDEPVGVFPIDPTKNEQYVTFKMPDSVIGTAATGYSLHSLTIKLSARMFMNTKVCVASDPTAAWLTVVSEDSTLDTQHLVMNMPDMQAYPYPFVTTTPDDTPTAIVLPPNPDTVAMSQGLNLAMSLGNSGRRSYNLLMLTYDQAQQANVSNANLIVLGVDKEQPLVKAIYEQLGNDQSKLAVDALNTPGTGVLLETVSPLNGSRTALLVTGQTKDAFVGAATSLFDAAPPVTQTGSLAVVQPGQPPHPIAPGAQQPGDLAPPTSGAPTGGPPSTQQGIVQTAVPVGTPKGDTVAQPGAIQLVAIIVAPLLIIGLVAVVWTVWSRRTARATVGISDLVASNKEVFPATVLVIEDDKSSNRLIQKHLVLAGFEVEVAYDGISGIQAAKAKKPDLIIVDAMMPDMDGYETARRIRAIDGLADVPIVMLTALSTIDHKVQAFEAGINEYMTKPFDGTELVMRAIALLKR